MNNAYRPNCLVCKNSGVFNSEIYSGFTSQRFEYLKCENCGLGWISNPNTNFDSIYDIKYYQGVGADLSINYWDEMFPGLDTLNRKLRRVEYQGIHKTLRKNTTVGRDLLLRHLDFGGGLGGLVSFLIGKDCESVLFEEGFASEIAIKHGVPCVQNLASISLNCITAIEVFEHLIDPDEAVKSFAGALEIGGILLITTGNLS